MCAFAQTVRLQAPDVCEVGRRINVSYVVDTQDVEDIRVGEFQGFELLYGPSTSTQSSFQMINGKTSQSSTVTFTYVLMAKKEGEFQLPAATVKVSGKDVRSGTAMIQVLPSSDNNQNNARGGGTSPAHPRSQSGNSVDDNDLFITATVSKGKVFEQEAVVLTYKLYTLVNLRQLVGEMPELDGFHCQELNSKAQLSLRYEHYKGRNYGTAVWRQYLLFPQKSGKLTIPSISFDAEVEITNHNADPFDIFFGGGSLTQLIRKTVHTPSLEIDVASLPTPRPAGFSGAVGKFSMKGTLTPDKLDANDAATMKLVVSGYGNMKLMKAPTVDMPKDFETYTPKETENVTNTSQGAKGSVTFDYVIVPRHGGEYPIPPVEFVYFDPEARKYMTLHTEPFHLSVAKGKQTVSGSTVREKEDLRMLSSDIHYIKSGDIDTSTNVYKNLDYSSYVRDYIILILVFIIIARILHYWFRHRSDVERIRGKRAGKAAAKRLKVASKLLKEHDAGAFYEETLKALLGYVADKLNLPMTSLTKDNVRETMVLRGIGEELIQQYMEVLESCEYAHFAPGDPVETMDRIFESATNVINALDRKL
ncbi:MAG: BatD family protein [Bacteroidaceae bacterium]|nr:BatD family protein [Bacteroidaceae bacterium]